MKSARRLLWVAVCVAALALWASRRLSGQESSALEGALGHVPAFELANQNGTTVTDRDLHGQIWIVSFVFTRCVSVCPMLTAKFRSLQGQLRDVRGLSYVSITVDPEYDTPAVLSTYAQRFGADGVRWQFLTGPLADIERTVVRGFKIHIGDRAPSAHDPSLVEIMHGEHFVLIDADGGIRGYYRGDAEGLAQLSLAARSLSAQLVQ